MSVTVAAPADWSIRTFHWWPTVLGAVFALAQGLGVRSGLASIVMVCAVIYLFAAVTTRPGSAWIGFAVSLPLVALSKVFDTEWLSLAAIGGLGVIVAIVGLVRGTWRNPVYRLQLVGALVFSVIAVLAVLAPPLVTGILIAAGLLGHGVWDLVHHARNQVVSRRYAEFCAALDLVLAVVVIVLLVIA